MGVYTVIVLDVGVGKAGSGGVGFLFFFTARNGAWQPRVQRKQTSRLAKPRGRVKMLTNT